MGLLALGTALDWPEAKQHAQQVRDWGIKQLLAIWNKAKHKERDALLWGDEVEYLVVTYSRDNPHVLLSLRQADILAALANDQELCKKGGCVPDIQAITRPNHEKPLPVFHPEFGRFMLEATPGKPWGIDLRELLLVEPDMRLRRTIAKDHMRPDEYPITLTTFPLLGCPGIFTDPVYPVSGPRLRSQFVPDEIANPHIRFPTLAANIRSRRGRKVQVNVPVFRDEHTPWPWRDPTVNYELHKWPEDDDVRRDPQAAPEGFIHMDAMAFGMGSCCLQITFQAKNITEGRRMYDQLSPLGPVMLALTAATPIYKGFLADTDVRWNQISRAVDDRTAEELGERPLQHDRWRIPKSRYAANSTYISTDPRLRREYLDPRLVVDDDIKAQLLAGGMDDLLATHFAHLFIRDPLVIFAEDLRELDLAKTDHFENLQSTNWQHMRFKPPPADNSTGWRVEFRPMEIQVTDFENAAFAVFIVLVTRAILSFDLNFYIPITRVDENMETAHARDAVLERRFHFRRNVFPGHKHNYSHYYHNSNTSINNSGTSTPAALPSRPPTPSGPVEDEYHPPSINKIINSLAFARASTAAAAAHSTESSSATSGTSSSPAQANGASADDDDDDFPGLLPLVESYLDALNVDIQTRCELGTYLDLIRQRASGRLCTAARWIRAFVAAHPAYQHDSAVPEQVVHDLVTAVVAVGEREQRGAGFAGLYGSVPGLEGLLGGFRRCDAG